MPASVTYGESLLFQRPVEQPCAAAHSDIASSVRDGAFELAEQEHVPAVAIVLKNAPDGAIRLVGMRHHDHVGARGVIVVNQADAVDRDPVHDGRFAHERRDRGDAAVDADDQHVQLGAGAESVPPGAHPLVAQERMRDARAVDGLVPGALEGQERVVLADDVDRAASVH